MKPCDICLEEKCEGRHDCHCDTCNLKDKCYRQLKPTIRITNRCTQECSHCCFESSPKSNVMMSVEAAEKIAKFIKNNGIKYLNLMGGEFFCNPDWFEIYSNLISAAEFSRLVTNGDWVNNMKVKTQLATLVSLFGNKMYFCISKDIWHTNKNVEAAEAYLKEIGAIVRVATEEQTTKQSIVPVGRAWGQYISGIYDSMGCYCDNPENMYTFLIDEVGNIYKCAFGILCYAHIEDYLEGGFSKMFKEANMKFYKVFIPSCLSCYSFISSQGKDYMVSHA